MLKTWFDNKLFDKVRVEVLSKSVIASFALLATCCTASLYSFQRHEPEFIRNLWISIDGSVVMFGKSLDRVELHGMPEGELIIEFQSWDKKKNVYRGVIYCLDHGGVVGDAVLILEPRNQLHLIVSSEFDDEYQFDIVFKTK
ncbi:hypothetical protein [Rubinisphaera italica]|uniref:Uncharacterized protein n=1 Tax=Rubinisphaera italica TaxID=2527969 RepID=A0A5C5XJC9_9PLAN|nr:hypothetical protein [Rubinisphaera italica]TWT62828.1 hypothetical protein Pan54_35740 [Rubinisphaera italica]